MSSIFLSTCVSPVYHVLCQNYCPDAVDNICSFLKLRVDFTVARYL